MRIVVGRHWQSAKIISDFPVMEGLGLITGEFNALDPIVQFGRLPVGVGSPRVNTIIGQIQTEDL